MALALSRCSCSLFAVAIVVVILVSVLDGTCDGSRLSPNKVAPPSTNPPRADLTTSRALDLLPSARAAAAVSVADSAGILTVSDAPVADPSVYTADSAGAAPDLAITDSTSRPRADAGQPARLQAQLRRRSELQRARLICSGAAVLLNLPRRRCACQGKLDTFAVASSECRKLALGDQSRNQLLAGGSRIFSVAMAPAPRAPPQP